VADDGVDAVEGIGAGVLCRPPYFFVAGDETEAGVIAGVEEEKVFLLGTDGGYNIS
jgi:hypothetical protein